MNKDYPNFLRERITQLRLEKNISEYHLSYSIGKCKTYIQAITSGKSLPAMEPFFDICEYFELTPAEFFQDTQKDSAQLRRIIHKARKLSDKDLELLEQILDKF
ncbi:MAG: helix-turn-helix transcriptional regulator [Lachnospiraceae bacterium]|nr:helix-turn-helix transcriptional regulator [Lachnospiraceae bacterium]